MKVKSAHDQIFLLDNSSTSGWKNLLVEGRCQIVSVADEIFFVFLFFWAHGVLSYFPTLFKVTLGYRTNFGRSEQNQYVSLFAGSFKSHMQLTISCPTGVLLLRDTSVERKPPLIMVPKGLRWAEPLSFYKVYIIVVLAYWDFGIVYFYSPSWLMSEPSMHLKF